MSRLHVAMAFCCKGVRGTSPPEPPAILIEHPHASYDFHFQQADPALPRITIPKEQLDASLGLIFVIGFHSEGITGRHTVQVKPPSIADGKIASLDVEFQDGHSTVNVIPAEVWLRTSGAHWFEVCVNGETLSRILVQVQLPHD